ncbi:MAG: type II toxin-antitoxin system RelB/DinJ family antitoxin [Clostridia bacterium]|nr:type II toxin-antitoxin system RelB/DinJ family antitoxin [Clostridia bacterium]
MAEQVLNQFRSDKALRDECAAIYEAMGMDLNTAFRMFMERTRMVRGLPFPAVLPEKQMTKLEAKAAIQALRDEAANLPEMSLDEINTEISAVRAERKKRS